MHADWRSHLLGQLIDSHGCKWQAGGISHRSYQRVSKTCQEIGSMIARRRSSLQYDCPLESRAGIA
eukprot:8819222-Pyramimonas_sp.AAC.1